MAQTARAAAAAPAGRPQPHRRLPGHALPGDRDVRVLLLPDHLRPGSARLQRPALRGGVPPLRGGHRGDVRHRVADRRPDRARPLMVAGAAVAAGGLYWFTHITVHSTYVGGLLGPMLLTSAGFGMLFVPMSLVALSRVQGEDSGIASSLLNTGQQVGGAIGLAALGTVTWTAVSNSVKHQVAQAAAAAAHAGHPLPAARPGASVPAAVLHQALATGISRGFLVAAGIAVVALVVAVAMIRVRRDDLAGAVPVPDDASGLGNDIELEGSV